MRSTPLALVVLGLFTGCDSLFTPLKGEKDAADQPAGGELEAARNEVAPARQPAAPNGAADPLANADLEPLEEIPPAVQPPAPAAGANESRLVRLSTGVALAQTLPTGTGMGFSVDYRFLVPPPSSGVGFALAVKDGRGQTHLQPAAVNPSGGTIAFFVPAWKPNQAPFEAVLLMGDGHDPPRPVSNVIDLR